MGLGTPQWGVLSGEAQTLEMVLPFADACDFFDTADFNGIPGKNVSNRGMELQNQTDCISIVLNNSISGFLGFFENDLGFLIWC